jgi:hypothetical protein
MRIASGRRSGGRRLGLRARVALAPALYVAGALAPAYAQHAQHAQRSAPPPSPATRPPPPAPQADPILLGGALGFGGFGRLDGGTYALPPSGALDVSAAVALRATSTFGGSLRVSHQWLAREVVGATPAWQSIRREVTTAWATLDVTPWRFPLEPLVSLGIGLAVQRVGATGLVRFWDRPDAVTYRCTGDGGAGPALGAHVGARGRLGAASSPGAWAQATVGVELLQLPSDPVANCALGAGMATLVGARIAFGYDWDVTRALR